MDEFRKSDGFEPAEPQGFLAKAEIWCFDHGLLKLGKLLGQLDERGLGK